MFAQTYSTEPKIPQGWRKTGYVQIFRERCTSSEKNSPQLEKRRPENRNFENFFARRPSLPNR